MEIYIYYLIFVGVVGGIWVVWKFLQWLAHAAEKDRIQEGIEKIKQNTLYKSTLEESSWLKEYIDRIIHDVFSRNDHSTTLEEAIKQAKVNFESNYEELVEERFWDIANHMEKYINTHPLSSFLTLQNIHDEVLRCSKDGMKLPDYMIDAAVKRYLAIKQIDIRLKLQKLEEVGALEKHEKMERGELMDKLDKTFEIWEKNGQKEENEKKKRKKPRTKNEEMKKLDIIHHIWENNDKEKND